MDMQSIHDALKQTLLEQDVEYIIALYENECNYDFDKDCISMKRGMYNTPVEMYNDILKIVQRMGYSSYFIEFMPIIDEYLEIFFN